ncbi:molybdopterin-dependent oxidoreductase [Priestia koreensis]|uniref:molybdopterin-dependent oxidoreductase n=1 Tax=Priestia koreensis TaxID=284581 RepID=UPI00345B01C8
MDWRVFFKRGLPFRRRLVRLHHANALFFLILSISGFILFSGTFRTALPSVRVYVRDIHVWIGIVSILPLLYYLPKMARHLKGLKKKQNQRINLYLILTVLSALIGSGLLLTYHRQFSPQVSTVALFIHDAATWFGVPYTIYHSITRSRWFKKAERAASKSTIVSEPMEINEKNPIYTRRSFLRVASGGIIVLIFSPFIFRWIKPFFPSMGGQVAETASKNKLVPKPTPNVKSSPPIGGGKKGEFRYYTVTEVPTITNQNFSFTIDGLVQNKKRYNWEQFVSLKRDVQVSDFHCITGWSVYNVTWEGIPLRKILQEAGVKSKAKYVKFYSADGVYTDTLTLKQAMAQDIMVATLIDGKLISQDNGGPVRLITPRMYAYKSVKWLNRIELIEEEHVGYWEERGYSKNAWVKS